MEYDGLEADGFPAGHIRVYDFNKEFLDLTRENNVTCNVNKHDLVHYNAFAMHQWLCCLYTKMRHWFNM